VACLAVVPFAPDRRCALRTMYRRSGPTHSPSVSQGPILHYLSIAGASAPPHPTADLPPANQHSSSHQRLFGVKKTWSCGYGRAVAPRHAGRTADPSSWSDDGRLGGRLTTVAGPGPHPPCVSPDSPEDVPSPDASGARDRGPCAGAVLGRLASSASWCLASSASWWS